jgi:putative ABC transport system permease protein
VNATLAAHVWPGVSALGKCIVLGKIGEPCRRVVGIVSNAHYSQVVESPSMQFYVPLTQQGEDGKPTMPGAMDIRVAEGHSAAVAGAVQRLLLQMAPKGVKPVVRIFSEQLDPQLRPWRLGAALFTAAGLLALLVAGVGIYGTIAYTFSQRTQEIGVRIALGAQGSSIIALVLKSSAAVALIGVVVGTGLSLWAGRFAKPLLYETSPNNPFVLGGVALVLLAVAVIASLVPAMRAKSIDPLEALRAE